MSRAARIAGISGSSEGRTAPIALEPTSSLTVARAMPREELEATGSPPLLWTAPPPARECHRCGGLLGHPMIRRSQIMQTTTTIGLDIAKSVFPVHSEHAINCTYWL